LKKYAKLRGWEIFDIYVDEESGRAEKKSKREAFGRMMDDAQKRKFDVLLVFRYSRFARSTKDLVDALRDFEALGIDFVSYSENIDTTTSHGKFFFTVIAAFAQLESDTISDNVKAGLSRAKEQGQHLGRPPLSTSTKERIIESWQETRSMKKTSKLLKKPYATVHKVVAAYPQEHPDEKTIQVELWLRVDNNNKFVRGKTESRQIIEDVVLSK
jgi:DNA invertase Pin-like site-specific DNA recombinase